MAKKKELAVSYGSPDKPIKVGEFELQCFVLNDEKRVLVQSGILKAMGMSRGSAGKGGDRLANFIAQDRLKPFIDSKLRDVITHPIKFKTPNGMTAYGYEATILVDICDAVLEASKQGKLQKQQKHIAETAEMLVRAFAKTGIIALIDEVTGYQKTRDRDALQRFFDKALQEEQAKWVKTFDDDFFEMIFKMKGWTWYFASTKKPSVVGHYINDFVYSRIAPDLVIELKKLSKDPETGKKKGKLFQHLTPDYGHPKLKQHLASLIALGRASGHNWNNFKRMVERAFPKFGDTPQIQFPDDDE
jgi:hypothetical protein